VRIEEAIKKTLTEAISQKESIEIQEKVVKQKAREVEISLIKQKEEIKKEFTRQITETKRECYTCDNGVHKLVKDRSELDRIKQLEKAAGGFALAGKKPFSKAEMMAAMKAIIMKRAMRKQAAADTLKSGMQVIQQKRIERKMQRQEEKINTLKYQVKRTKSEERREKSEKKMVKTFQKQQTAMKMMAKFEQSSALKESKRIHQERVSSERS